MACTAARRARGSDAILVRLNPVSTFDAIHVVGHEKPIHDRQTLTVYVHLINSGIAGHNADGVMMRVNRIGDCRVQTRRLGGLYQPRRCQLFTPPIARRRKISRLARAVKVTGLRTAGGSGVSSRELHLSSRPRFVSPQPCTIVKASNKERT